ncbi:hypothetical protein HDV02_006128 [Globomyces sp. JEL0801]|nr:hypothetical protein HDV02_006128 [Globomyces sp. JEL0801]
MMKVVLGVLAVGAYARIDMLEPKPRVPMGDRTTAQQVNLCGGEPIDVELPSNPRVKFSTLGNAVTFKTYDNTKRCNFFLAVGDKPDFDPISLYDAAQSLENLKAGGTNKVVLDKISAVPEWVVGATGTLQIECIEASRGNPITHQCVDLVFDDVNSTPSSTTTVVSTTSTTVASTTTVPATSAITDTTTSISLSSTDAITSATTTTTEAIQPTLIGSTNSVVSSTGSVVPTTIAVTTTKQSDTKPTSAEKEDNRYSKTGDKPYKNTNGYSDIENFASKLNSMASLLMFLFI